MAYTPATPAYRATPPTLSAATTGQYTVFYAVWRIITGYTNADIPGLHGCIFEVGTRTTGMPGLSAVVAGLLSFSERNKRRIELISICVRLNVVFIAERQAAQTPKAPSVIYAYLTPHTRGN